MRRLNACWHLPFLLNTFILTENCRWGCYSLPQLALYKVVYTTRHRRYTCSTWNGEYENNNTLTQQYKQLYAPLNKAVWLSKQLSYGCESALKQMKRTILDWKQVLCHNIIVILTQNNVRDLPAFSSPSAWCQHVASNMTASIEWIEKCFERVSNTSPQHSARSLISSTRKKGLAHVWTSDRYVRSK